MLSVRTIRTLSDVVKYCTPFKAMLFEWDPARCRLNVTKSWRQRTYFTIIAFYLSIEAMYQGCTLYSESHKSTISFESYMKLVSHFFTRLCGLLLTFVNGYNAKSITMFINHMLQMNRRFTVYFRHQKLRDKSERKFLFFKYFLYLQPLIPAFTYVNEYEDKRYWQGALFPVFILPFIRPCFFVVEYWISLYVLVGPYFSMYITCSHCFTTPAWMTVLSSRLKQVNIHEWRTKSVRNGSCKLYKGLQILNQLYNCCFANTMGVGLATCMGCLVLMLVFSVQLTPKVQFPGCLIFPVGAIGLLQVTRHAFASTVQVTESSVAFIESYRSTKNPLQAKIARSLMPLLIHVSVFSEMSRSTLLEFYSQVIYNTVSMLLI